MRLKSLTLVCLCLSACASTPPAPPVVESIVFMSQRSGSGDLYALDPVELTVSPVVTTAAPEGNPAWDRARNRLVYQLFEDEQALLYADGRRVMADPNGDVPPSWSSDGTFIVFAANRDGNENLYLARVDGSGERRLTDGRFTDRYPVFSPDGQSIAFARQDGFGWDLHTLDLKTAQIQRRTLDGVYVGHPAWSPDGQAIAFDRHYDGQAEIAVLDTASGALRRLTERGGNDLRPAFSLDGRRIAFAADAGGSWNLWEVGVNGDSLRQLTDSADFDGAPVYMPRSVWARFIEPSVTLQLE